MAAGNGTGATIALGTSAFDTSLQITNISWSGVERPAINTSHLGSTVAHSFVPGDLYDPGELMLDINWDPVNMVFADGSTNFAALSGTTETITITLPISVSSNTNAATITGTGFVRSFGMAVPLEDKMTGTIGIKFSGAVTMNIEDAA